MSSSSVNQAAKQLKPANYPALHSHFSLCVCFLLKLAKQSTAMERPQRLQRLESMRRDLPYASASALSGLLQHIQKHGLPDLVQRKHFKEASAKELEQHCTYGPLLIDQRLEGEDGHLVCTVANYLSLICAVFSQGGAYYAFLKLMEEHPPDPSDPYDLLLYSDEVIPGNNLLCENFGKVWAHSCMLQVPFPIPLLWWHWAGNEGNSSNQRRWMWWVVGWCSKDLMGLSTGYG